MVHIQNDCVGCPQGCISCGRKEDYYVYECDLCGSRFYDESSLTKVDSGKDVCEECLKELDGEGEDEQWQSALEKKKTS